MLLNPLMGVTLSNLDACFTSPYAQSPPPFLSSVASSSSAILLLFHFSLSRHQKGSRGKTGFSSSIKLQLCAYLLEPFHLFIYLVCVLCVCVCDWLRFGWSLCNDTHTAAFDTAWGSKELQKGRVGVQGKERWKGRRNTWGGGTILYLSPIMHACICAHLHLVSKHFKVRICFYRYVSELFLLCVQYVHILICKPGMQWIQLCSHVPALCTCRCMNACFHLHVCSWIFPSINFNPCRPI